MPEEVVAAPVVTPPVVTPPVVPPVVVAPPVVTPPVETPADWRTGIPEDLKEAARNFKSPFDAVKSARDLRGKLSNAIYPLDEKATDEEKADHSKKVAAFFGVPDSPDKYVFKNPDKLPDGNDPEVVKATQADFAKAMHAKGVPPAHAQEAINWLWEFTDRQQGSLATARLESNAKADAEIRKAWGGAYDTNLALSQRAITDYGGPELATALARTGLGNNLALANALRDLGAYRSEDGMVGGATSAETKTLVAQADEKMADPAYNDPGNPKYLKLREEVSALYARAYPGGPEIGPGVGA